MALCSAQKVREKWWDPLRWDCCKMCFCRSSEKQKHFLLGVLMLIWAQFQQFVSRFFLHLLFGVLCNDQAERVFVSSPLFTRALELNFNYSSLYLLQMLSTVRIGWKISINYLNCFNQRLCFTMHSHSDRYLAAANGIINQKAQGPIKCNS